MIYIYIYIDRRAELRDAGGALAAHGGDVAAHLVLEIIACIHFLYIYIYHYRNYHMYTFPKS